MASVYRVANEYDGALGGFASFERSAPGRQLLVLDRDERADRGVGPDLGGGGEWELDATEALGVPNEPRLKAWMASTPLK